LGFLREKILYSGLLENEVDKRIEDRYISGYKKLFEKE
jgi:hypothetical protein